MPIRYVTNWLKNEFVMKQIANNTREQAMLGDFPKAMDDAILGSSTEHQEDMMHCMCLIQRRPAYLLRVIFDMLSSPK